MADPGIAGKDPGGFGDLVVDSKLSDPPTGLFMDDPPSGG